MIEFLLEHKPCFALDIVKSTYIIIISKSLKQIPGIGNQRLAWEHTDGKRM